MSRKAILDTYYTFTPATRTIVIPRAIRQERLLLITDLATNTVIYNFSDPTLKTTSYTTNTDTTGSYTTTTIVLNYNTTALSTTDKLQIIIDEYDEKFTPAETMIDSVNKLRVSTPQSLIDTDYEYSTQFTKWEAVGLTNNRPFAYFSSVNNNLNLIDLQAVQYSRTYTANVFPATPPAVGTPVTIVDSVYGGADGTYLVDANVTTSNTFSYTGKFYYTNTSGSIFDITRTQGYQSFTYTNAAIAVGTGTTANIVSLSANALPGTSTTANLVSFITSQPHGLSLGNEIGITGVTGTGNATVNGSYVVNSIANATAFSYLSTGTTSPNVANLILTNASLYTRPMGLTLHRPTQAGVRFSVNEQSHNAQYIRQTRRYFRYQSGKGIQMSTGTTLQPNMFFDSVTYNSSTGLITVTTKDPHNIWSPSVTVVIAGCNEAGYNGTYTSVTVLTPYQFTVAPTVAPIITTASGQYYGAVTAWYTGGTRIGLFDSNNGVFFEFDGQQLWAVRRSATFNLAGTITMATGSGTVTGINTQFSKQLQPNDWITIKGMTYRVININNDTSMTINPSYRGLVNASSSIYTKVIDTKVPQSAWNIDRCDGTGPSGYTLNLAKNQMMYIDYSWYGAGHIRFGFRGADGTIVYCHKMINNNVNNIAYMRSGNLPARYETHTFSKSAILTGGAGGVGTNLNSSDTTMYISDAWQWPTSGTVLSRTGTQQEFMTFNGISQANQSTYTYSAGSFVLNLVSGSTTGIAVGQYVNGLGIPPLTTVQSFVAGVSVTLNNPVYLSTNASGNPINFAPQLQNLTRTTATAGGTFGGVTINSGNVTLGGFSSTTGIQIGQFVSGYGIPNQALVNSIGTNSVTLSIAPFVTSTGAVTFIGTNSFNGNSTGAQTFTYSSTAPVAVELHAPTYASEINHWGTSAIMDGGFTNDKQYIFTKGMTQFANVYPGANTAIMSFRIAPSASQGVAGSGIGLRDQINHMQMIPYELDAYSNGSFLMSVVINATPLASTQPGDTTTIPNWQNVGGSSLSQFIFHNANTTVTGGETIFGFYMNTTGYNVSGGPGIGNTYNTTQQDFTQVKDLGTNIIGGGQVSGNVGIYPDGPETITIVATNLSPQSSGKSGMANLVARYSWNEAQA